MAIKKVRRWLIVVAGLSLSFIVAYRILSRTHVRAAIQPATSEASPPDAAPTPRKEESLIEGIYHKDRWGVGWLGFTKASRNLVDRLSPFEGKPVRANYGGPVRTWNSRVDMFSELRSVEPLPIIPLKVSVSARPDRLAASRPFEVVIQLENVGSTPIRVRQLLADLHARYPRTKDNPEFDADLFNPFAPYGREQLSYSIKGGRMGLTPIASIDEPMTDPGDLHVASLFEIAPGSRFPLSLEFRKGLPADEFELGIHVCSLEDAPLGRDQWTLPSVWIPLDVHPGDESPSGPPPVGLRVTEKRLYKDVNSQYVLDVKLASGAEGPRKLVSRSGTGGKANYAGRIRAFDSKAQPIPVRTFGSNTGNLGPHESWRLDTIPDDGLVVRVRFTSAAKEASIQTIQLDLVSERGLERLILGDMPACFQSVKFVKHDD